MPFEAITLEYLTKLWKVLVLFLIPIGGGIPAGVLLAKEQGFTWPLTTFLYFISDVILALVFEPIMLIVISYGKKVSNLQRFGEVFKEALQKTTAQYGHGTGPLALVMVAFGVDPMTGRTVAVAAGHGFVTGWMIAITGDMLYFGVIMASTLWLKDIIGDGTWTMWIILILMILVPLIIKKIKSAFKEFRKQT